MHWAQRLFLLTVPLCVSPRFRDLVFASVGMLILIGAASCAIEAHLP